MIAYPRSTGQPYRMPAGAPPPLAYSGPTHAVGAPRVLCSRTAAKRSVNALQLTARPPSQTVTCTLGASHAGRDSPQAENWRDRPSGAGGASAHAMLHTPRLAARSLGPDYEPGLSGAQSSSNVLP